MFRQSLTMHGWNLHETAYVVEHCKKQIFFLPSRNNVEKTFNFHFIVTVKRIILLYRWSAILFELALDATLKIDRILLSLFQLVCWTMLLLELVLNLLLAAEVGFSSQNTIPFSTVSHLFVEFSDLTWNYPDVLLQAVLILPSPLCSY